MHFTTIPLVPTLFSLDVIVCPDKDKVVAFLSERYGETVEYYEEIVTGPFTSAIMFNGEERLLMVLKSFDAAVMAHEASHIVWKLAKRIGWKIRPSSQEIMAYYISHIVDTIEKLVTPVKVVPRPSDFSKPPKSGE